MGNLPDSVSLRAIDARSYGGLSQEAEERLENTFAWRKALEGALRGIQAELITLRGAADRIGPIDGVAMDQPIEFLDNLAADLAGEIADARREIANIDQWDEDRADDRSGSFADWARDQRMELGA